jgi:hypothetical protein
VEEFINVYRILVGKLEERDFYGDLDVDGKKVLKCILNGVCGCGLHSSSEKMDPVVGSCKHSNGPLGSINGREVFLIS